MDNRYGGYKIGKVPDDAKRRARSNSKQLPQRVDLRKFLTSIESQVGNSCVANAMAGAYEYLAKRELGDSEDVSRLYIYYNARYIDESQDEDGGSYMHSAIKGLMEYGACSEQMWPNDEEMINDEPHEDAYTQGGEFCIVEAEAVDTDLQLWKETLSAGFPIAFALNTFKNFDDASRNKGRVPMPKDNAETRKTHGWHAMLCVGYSDIDRVFIVRNSWGEDWGDKGYCYIPYDYVMHDSHNAHDSWVIKSVQNLDYSEGVEVEGDDSYFYDDEYLQLSDYYVYTEDSNDFLERLEALLDEWVESEDDYFFDWEVEEDEDGTFIQFGEFYLLVEDQEGFLEALDALSEEFAGEDGYDYTVDEGEEEDEDEDEDEDGKEKINK